MKKLQRSFNAGTPSKIQLPVLDKGRDDLQNYLGREKVLSRDTCDTLKTRLQCSMNKKLA